MSSQPGHARGHGQGHGPPGRPLPRLIAWEVTRTCPMNCRHCRAAARHGPYAGELSTQECFSLLDNIASFSKPIIILTGGEPMTRADIYDIAARGVKLGLPVVMAPCGLLLNDETAAKIVQAGIRLISISLDGATARTHDAFRAYDGSFDACLSGIAAATRAGLPFQINTTVSRHNVEELPAILDLAVQLGAKVFNPFLLVPTGRGKELMEQELSPDQYERTLRWLAGQQGRKDIPIRVTCAPHYQRIVRQCGLEAGPAEASRGCIGGKAFAFVSHVGKVQICGFLDVECGDLRREGMDFRKIWETSEVFRRIRDVDSYRGRCGYCEYRQVCGGCRARAYAAGGDYLGEEPFCAYQPRKKGDSPFFPQTEKSDSPPLDETDKRILDAIQADFPVARRPYDVLGERLGTPPQDILRRVGRMTKEGCIRRLGAVFDARRLGYFSTLAAAKVPPDRLTDVARLVSELPGVTHNYRREHAYNLWFTLTARSEEEVAAALDRLRRQTGLADIQSLPALTVYKSRVVFWMSDGPPANSPVRGEKGDSPHFPQTENGYSPLPPPPPVELDGRQKDLVRILQDSLPLVDEPFEAVARRLGWPLQSVLDQIAEWLSSGVIKRLGAVLDHRQAGFEANGMAVFAAAEDRIDPLGARLAREGRISHCYRRPTLPDWPYNLFAMVHGRTEAEVRQFVAGLARELGLDRYDILFSTEEYKKVSMRFFVEAM